MDEDGFDTNGIRTTAAVATITGGTARFVDANALLASLAAVTIGVGGARCFASAEARADGIGGGTIGIGDTARTDITSDGVFANTDVAGDGTGAAARALIVARTAIGHVFASRRGGVASRARRASAVRGTSRRSKVAEAAAAALLVDETATRYSLANTSSDGGSVTVFAGCAVGFALTVGASVASTAVGIG
jgi:hypothetical protein